jgi:hypothetical protein
MRAPLKFNIEQLYEHKCRVTRDEHDEKVTGSTLVEDLVIAIY